MYLHVALIITSHTSLSQGCFGRNLDPHYAELIATFRRKFEVLQDHARDVLDDGIQLSTTWKMHILRVHVEQWLDKHPTGLGLYAEQTCEASHRDFIRTEKRFLVAESHPDHGKRMKRALVEYSSRHL